MNKTWAEERREGYAHELCRFLGGDETAFRISNALRRWGDIASVDDLRKAYAGDWGRDWLKDTRGIGPAAIGRISQQLNN